MYNNYTYKATLDYYAKSIKLAKEYFESSNINDVTVLIAEDNSVYRYIDGAFELDTELTADELTPGLNYYIVDLSIEAVDSSSDYFASSGTVIYSKDGNWQIQIDRSKSPDNVYIQYNDRKQLTVNTNKVAVYIDPTSSNKLELNKTLNRLESNTIKTSNIDIITDDTNEDGILTVGNASFTNTGTVYSGTSEKSNSIKQNYVKSSSLSYPILLSGINILDTSNDGTFSTPNMSNDLYYDFDTKKLVVKGDVEIAGDFVTTGNVTSLEIEDIKIESNYIYLRNGSTTPLTELGEGSSSGIIICSYEKTSDNALTDAMIVLDKTGTLKIGDVGDLQPVATRADASDMLNDYLVK